MAGLTANHARETAESHSSGLASDGCRPLRTRYRTSSQGTRLSWLIWPRHALLPFPFQFFCPSNSRARRGRRRNLGRLMRSHIQNASCTSPKPGARCICLAELISGTSPVLNKFSYSGAIYDAAGSDSPSLAWVLLKFS